MYQKIIMACTAIAAFAAFVAPSALATNLTDNGVTVKTGSSLKWTNIGNTLINAGELTTTCTAATLSGNTTTDTGGQLKSEIPAGNPSYTGTGTSGDCTSPLGSVKLVWNSKLCLDVNNSDGATTHGCGSNLTFSLNVTGIVICTYQTASMSGTITTSSTGDAQVTFVNDPVARDTGNPFFCPASATYTAKFALTTTDGTTLSFSA